MPETFNDNPFVSHPEIFVPMQVSSANQAPFFFGGSQVPSALHLETRKMQGEGVGKAVLKHKANKTLRVMVDQKPMPIFK